jgi:hypothetical protein
MRNFDEFVVIDGLKFFVFCGDETSQQPHYLTLFHDIEEE